MYRKHAFMRDPDEKNSALVVQRLVHQDYLIFDAFRVADIFHTAEFDGIVEGFIM